MQIKNMRLFREQYKKELQNTEYNENYVGAYNPDSKEFGYFSLIHGGAKMGESDQAFGNFLEAFLDMAGDGQAVYEFLQNAVDVQSTQFFIRWGQIPGQDDNYVLVMNNGRPFSEKDIKSILNIGMSTKTNIVKGQEHTIGKFGIGFKLAHRLVGASNGRDELLNGYQGPILFSWSNEEWKTLASDEPLILMPLGDPQGDSAPWFFKILMTCFPCLPGEPVYDITMNQRELFTTKEVQVLRTYLQLHRDDIGDGFAQGSMFFIRLGRDKEKMLLADNLDTGVRFSTAILNRVAQNQSRMDRVVMNHHVVVPPDLRYWSLSIGKEAEDQADFNYIINGNADYEGADTNRHQSIQLLIGYTDYQSARDLFLDVPNLYLYFPLSEEKHAFNFVIHSNAFYMASSRTKLHDGTNKGGINQRLFEVLIRRLSQDMETWFASERSEDQQLLLTLYPNLLLANRVPNTERAWVNNAFIAPLQAYLANNIPVRYRGNLLNVSNGGGAATIQILSTQLPLIDTPFLPQGIQWFYWSTAFEDGDELLCERAGNQLGIARWTVISLLKQPALDVVQLGNWLIEDNSRISIFLSEINSYLEGGYRAMDKAVEDKLSALKLFAFRHGDEAHYFSLKDLDKEAIRTNCLLRFANMVPLEPYLSHESVGFILSELTLTDYPNIYNYLKTRQSIVAYIGDFPLFNRIVSGRLRTNTFTPDEKAAVLKGIEQLTDISGAERDKRVRFIELYTNQLPDIGPIAFERLVSPKLNVPNWLTPFEVNGEEYRAHPDMERYTTHAVAEVYVSVILPNWELITQRPPADAAMVYQRIIDYYSQAAGQPTTLTNKPYLLANEKWVPLTANLYFHEKLKSVDDRRYESLRVAMQSLFGLQLPDRVCLDYLDQDPFRTSSRILKPASANVEAIISREDLSALLAYCQSIDFPFFDQFVVESTEENSVFLVTAASQEWRQYYHGNELVQHYVSQHTERRFGLLPDAFSSQFRMVALRDDELLRQLIDNIDATDTTQLTELCRIARRVANSDTHKVLLEKIGPITISLDSPVSVDELVVEIVNLWAGSPKDRHKTARQQIHIQEGEHRESLDVVALRGADTLLIGQQELSISEILMGSQNNRFSSWVSQILTRFSPLIDHPGNLRNLLNLDQTPDAKEVYDELVASLTKSHYIIKNAAQIAFIALFRQTKKDPIEWRVYNEAKVLCKLTGVFYVAETTCSFLPPTCRLRDDYIGLAATLAIDEKRPEYKTVGFSIRYEPVLESNATINLNVADNKKLSTECQIEFLSWYYRHWLKLERPLECRPQNNGLDSWLGFDPRALIVESTFACQEADSGESMPVHVSEWMNEPVDESDPTRQEFMRVLGVHQASSPVVAARKFLAGWSNHPPYQSLNPFHSYYTLRWLEEGEITIPDQDQSRKSWLTTCYQQSSQFATQDIPLPQLNPDLDVLVLGRFGSKPGLLLTATARQTLNMHVGSIPALARHRGAGILDDSLLSTAHKQQLPAEIPTSWQVTNIKISVDTGLFDEAIEYDAPFYQKWRTTHDHRIFRLPGGVPFQLNVFDSPFYDYRDENESVLSNDLKTLYVPAAWNEEAIFAVAEEKWPTIGAGLRQEFQQLNQYILELFSRPNTDQSINKEIEQLRKKIELQREVDEAKEVVNNPDNRYTLAWFRALIELEQKLSNRVNLMNEKEGNIDFTVVETMPIEQNQEHILLRLSHPSRTLSQNIEAYGNFVATIDVTLSGRRQSRKLDIKGVSKKGQTLLALVSQQAFREFEGVAIDSLGLSFSQQIDFLATLNDNYKRMGLADDYQFKSELTPTIHFVFGPPGTGKTTRLARTILDRMRQQPKAQLLVLTPTNKAADVLSSRILKEQTDTDNPDYWLARYGTTADEMLIEEGYFYDSNSWPYRPNAGAVLITTIHRFLYEQVSWGDGRILLNEISWPTIVVDEASMIALSYLNFVLHKRKYVGETGTLTEFIIGGDPFQLPPVVDIPNEADFDSSIKEENIYTMVGLQTFDPAEQAKIDRYGDSITNLEVQYRSVGTIGELFSQFQYEGRLTHHRATEQSRPLPTAWQELAFHPISCLRFTCNNDDTIYRPQRLRQSPYQLYSAQLLVETVRWMSKRLPTSELPWTIGIVTPYRAQAQLINKLLETVVLPVNMIVVADTVHGFQGDECDMVFVLINPPNYILNAHPTAFVNKHHLINVAISRAKDYLILMYPDNATMGIDKLKLISQSSAGSVEDIIHRLPLSLNAITQHTARIERILFQSDKYLQEHTFTQRHQMINVYSQPTLHFTVYSDENALDVQVRT